MTKNNMEIEATEALIKLVGIFDHTYNQKLRNRFERNSFKR